MLNIKHQFKFRIFIIFFILQSSAFSQSGILLRTILIDSYPFSNQNSDLFKQKIDPNGLFTFEPGVVFSYELFVRELIYSLRFEQAIYFDAASKFAGFTQLHLHARLYQRWQHTVSFGFGPSFNYRKSWKNLKDYQDDSYYNTVNDVQYNLAFVTATIEYTYYLKEHYDFALALMHCYPDRIMLTCGYRYWFSKKVKHKGGCNTCPKF